MDTLINDGKPFVGDRCDDHGMTRSELYQGVGLHRLRRIFRNVYIDSRAPDDRPARAAAISLVAPSYAVLCDEWAAWLWGVDTFPPGRRHGLVPSVVVPHHYGRARFQGVTCREAHIPRRDRTMVNGIGATNALRTTADLLRRQRRPYALASADAMARANVVAIDELWDYLPLLKGYPGIRQARSLVTLIDPSAASPGESWTRLRVVDAGFAKPEAQFEVVDPDGIVRYLDLAYPQVKIAIEYDGRGFHTGAHDQFDDDYRRSLLRALGFKFMIATYENIFGDDTTFERNLGELLGQTPYPRRW